jgi:hypothetical protein
MRGIERVITGILLAVAICGAAAFARGADRDAAGGSDVQLIAVPPQHARSAPPVPVPVYSLLTDRPTAAPVARTATLKPLLQAPVLTSTPVLRIATAPPGAHRRASAPVRKQQPAHVRSRHVPKAAPAPAPAQPAPAAPAQQPPSRILAYVPPTPTLPATARHAKGLGHGRLKNHPDDDSAAPAAPAQQQPQPAPAPAPQPTSPTITVVPLTPSEPASNGNGHGHAYGRLKQDANDHD